MTLCINIDFFENEQPAFQHFLFYRQSTESFSTIMLGNKLLEGEDLDSFRNEARCLLRVIIWCCSYGYNLYQPLNTILETLENFEGTNPDVWTLDEFVVIATGNSMGDFEEALSGCEHACITTGNIQYLYRTCQHNVSAKRTKLLETYVDFRRLPIEIQRSIVKGIINNLIAISNLSGFDYFALALLVCYQQNFVEDILNIAIDEPADNKRDVGFLA